MEEPTKPAPPVIKILFISVQIEAYYQTPPMIIQVATTKENNGLNNGLDGGIILA
jgi:hypothetical protein